MQTQTVVLAALVAICTVPMRSVWSAEIGRGGRLDSRQRHVVQIDVIRLDGAVRLGQEVAGQVVYPDGVGQGRYLGFQALPEGVIASRCWPMPNGLAVASRFAWL